MRLRELELHNICQHKYLSLEFNPGLIGIFGANGAGKSNSMNMAYAILTGDYSRLMGGKEGAIHQLAGPEEDAVGRLVIEHQGRVTEIKRNLRTGKDSLRSGDVLLKKASDIKSHVEGSLGLSRRIIDEYMFVQQRTLFDFISDQPAVRAKSLAHLCNTIHAESCWEWLGKQIEADSPLAAKIENNGDELRAAIGRAKSQLRKIEKQHEQITARLLPDKIRLKFEARLHRAERVKELQEEEPQLVGRKSAAHTARVTTRDALDALEQQKVELQQKLKAAETVAEQARLQRTHYRQQMERWKQRSEAEAELARLEQTAPAAVKPHAQADELDTLRNMLSSLKEAQKQDEKMLAAFDKQGVCACPTCKTLVSDLKETLAAARKATKSRTTEIARLIELEAAIKEQAKLVRDYETKLGLHTQAVSFTTRQLESVKDAKKPAGNSQVWTDQIKAFDDLKDEMQTVVKKWEAATRAHSNAQSSYVHAKRDLARCRAKISTQTVPEASRKRAEDRLAKHRTRELKLARLDATRDAANETLNNTRAELDRLLVRLKRSRTARRWVSRLSRVREVMHRDRLPRRVHRRALRRMEHLVGENLRRFYDPFRITTDEELNFVAHFADGTVMPAPGLSVGQQGVLALSFRFALNSLFASQLDMMVLDEPTEGLDVDNVQYLGRALQSLSEYTRNAGLQLIMVTHEQSLASVFDQVINIQKPA